jgi:glutamyl-tRNA reductase
MTANGPDALVALITHARHVPAPERERFGHALRDEFAGDPLILETCHRVEAYALVEDDALRLGLEALLPPGGRLLRGDDAVRHAMAVAVGRDSIVIGEDQILHQLRQSLDATRRSGGLDGALERLFALALQAGRRARSWRQGPQRSLADVALAMIERQTGSLRGRDILVVGAGKMGRLAAGAAVGTAASVSVANRSPDGARTLAATTGARVEDFDPGRRTGTFAGVIVALGGPWPIGSDAIDALAASATVVVDLSVPVAVPEAAVEALGPRFVSADAIARADADTGMAQDGSGARVDALVDRTVQEYLDWLKAHDGRAAADALIGRADREREAELALLWRRLPGLQPEARDAIEGMARHLTRRILREPLERLGRDIDGRDVRAVRDIFTL